MIKRFSFRKIAITSLLLLLSIILYNYPEQINTNINEMNTKKINVIRDVNGYLSFVKIDCKNDNIEDKINLIINDLILNGLIPKETRLNGYTLDNGLLKLDFSKELLNIEKNNEEKMIEAIIFSLTNLKEINKIMLYVDGIKLSALPSGKSLDLYLDKNYGINKYYDINTFKQINSVMLYFYDINNDLVPVSYYYNDNNNEKITIIFNELKSNAFISNNLTSYLNNELEMINYEILEDKIIIDFNDKLLDFYNNDTIIEEVKYVIGYSINETYGINKIEFTINSDKIDELILANK